VLTQYFEDGGGSIVNAILVDELGHFRRGDGGHAFHHDRIEQRVGLGRNARGKLDALVANEREKKILIGWQGEIKAEFQRSHKSEIGVAFHNGVKAFIGGVVRDKGIPIAFGIGSLKEGLHIIAGRARGSLAFGGTKDFLDLKGREGLREKEIVFFPVVKIEGKRGKNIDLVSIVAKGVEEGIRGDVGKSQPTFFSYRLIERGHDTLHGFGICIVIFDRLPIRVVTNRDIGVPVSGQIGFFLFGESRGDARCDAEIFFHHLDVEVRPDRKDLVHGHIEFRQDGGFLFGHGKVERSVIETQDGTEGSRIEISFTNEGQIDSPFLKGLQE